MDEDTEDEDDRVEREAEEVRAVQLQDEQEASAERCDHCKGALLAPVRLDGCRCVLCACCVGTAVAYLRRCPVCAAPAKMEPRPRTKKKAGAKPGGRSSGTSSGAAGIPVEAASAAELRRRMALRAQDASDPLYEELCAQRERLEAQVERQRSTWRIVLEYGNTCGDPRKGGGGGKGSGSSKVSYTTSVRVVGREGSIPKAIAKGQQDLLAKVEFDINPGSGAKPTQTHLRNCPGGSGSGSGGGSGGGASKPSIFTYAMGRTYPCVMTVYFVEALAAPPLTIEYYVQGGKARTTRRIVVEGPLVPTASEQQGASARRRRMKAMMSKKAALDFEADPPRCGWVSTDGKGGSRVDYYVDEQ